ncbi:MAG: glycosyltransferase family 39 protein [Cyanobacteria bacterium]|nr:glycosyltransferase family 39 protein [Cyanobacteriota bacterium]
MQWLKDYLIESLLFISFGVLFAFNLNEFSLFEHREEIYYFLNAQALNAHHTAGSSFSLMPPMLSWILSWIFWIFGSSLVSAHSFSWLIAMLTLIITYFISQHLFQQRTIAQLSTIILGTSLGFFKTAQLTQTDALCTLWIVLFYGIFLLWQENAHRIRSFQGESRATVRLLGLITGIIGLSKGFFSILPLVLYLQLSRGSQGYTGSNLTKGHAKFWLDFCLSLFAIMVLPLAIFISPESLSKLIFPFGWDVSQFAMNSIDFGVIKTVLFAGVPWWLFFLAGALSCWMQRAPHIKNPRDEAQRRRLLKFCLWLLLWHGLFPFAFLPFFSIFTAHYLYAMSKEPKGSGLFRIAVESTVIILMSCALVFVVEIFQVLPDGYPGSLWNLPGNATLSEIHLGDHLITLPFTIPIWKLWLTPLPAILLLGGILTYLMLIRHRTQFIAETLAISMMFALLCYNTITAPVLRRSVCIDFYKTITQVEKQYPNQLASTAIYGSDLRSANQRLKLKFLLQSNPQNMTNPHNLENKAALFSRFLTWQRHPALNQINLILLDEKAYFQLPADWRHHLRVVESHWVWELLPLELFLPKIIKDRTRLEADSVDHRQYLILFQLI